MYCRRSLCVPNGLRHAIGTGNVFLAYKSMIMYIELVDCLLNMEKMRIFLVRISNQTTN